MGDDGQEYPAALWRAMRREDPIDVLIDGHVELSAQEAQQFLTLLCFLLVSEPHIVRSLLFRVLLGTIETETHALK